MRLPRRGLTFNRITFHAKVCTSPRHGNCHKFFKRTLDDTPTSCYLPSPCRCLALLVHICSLFVHMRR